MTNENGVWCIVLASREIAASSPLSASERREPSSSSSLTTRDPLEDTIRRAHTLAPIISVGAVISERGDLRRPDPIVELPTENVFLQPDHRGTAYEVLLALLSVRTRMSPDTPIVFLPSDHVVSDEEVITSSLLGMVDWMARDPSRVYLLGAVPEGPHNQLGYIIPWYDAMHMASGVYEFVEEPDMRQARKLINAGALWNTFIFGGTWSSLLALYRPKFDATIRAFGAVLDTRSKPVDMDAMRAIYERLIPADFSRDLLVPQTHRLSVLRMPRCGWWPLKSPRRHRRLRRHVPAPRHPTDGTDAADSDVE